jgi:transcriptional regulator GlxA family with amidase domain
MVTNLGPAFAGSSCRRIAMLIYPGVAPLDVAGPLQVFGVANFLKKQKLYHVLTIAPSAAPVPTPVGFAFNPTCAMSDLSLPVDTLLISGGGAPDAGTNPEILNWIRKAAPKARRFGSICTGAFVLGAAGLLDGKHVTTHWAFTEELARRCPRSIVEIDPIFVRDGNLYSSAGISAGIDLALALVEDDHGRELALSIARYLVLFLKRSGGQAQFSAQLRAQYSTIPAIEKVQRWCQDNPQGDLGTQALSAVASMSVRNFVRRFRQDTGRTPGEYVLAIRTEAASALLTETSLSEKDVARRCGFGSPSTMRRAFISGLGVSPKMYRYHFKP